MRRWGRRIWAPLAALALGAGAWRAAAAPADGALYEPERVRDYALTFQRSDWEAALNAAGDTGTVPARLVVDDQALEQVGVRYKGLSSMLVRSRKKPLNLTTDAYLPGQRLLGFDVVNLNNGYSDPSFVREALMTEVLRPFMPSQQSAYAKVSVNDEYLGLYLAVEQVEGTFLNTWFPGSDGILVKADPPAGPGMGARTFHSSLEWEGEDLARYRPLYEVKTEGAEEAGLRAIREAARVFDAPLAEGGTADAELPAAAARVLNVDGALWYLAATNLFVNFDSYYFGHNYFLYLAEEDQRLHLLMWDTSLSFGGLELGPWGSGGSGPRVDPFAMDDSDERPLLRRLLAVPEWRADYAAHYRALLEGAFDPELLAVRAKALQARARPGLETDANRLFPLELFDRNLDEDVTARANLGPGGRSPGVLKFARERAAWLRTHPALQPPDHRLLEHARSPEAPRPGQPATLRLRVAGADLPEGMRLVYRVDGGAPESIELARAGDAWEGTLPGQAAGATVSYYARAALPGGRSAFHPVANQTQAWRYTVLGPELPLEPGGDLVINELMADNAATLADEAGEFDDWLELHNRGSAALRLSDYYLGPNATDPWRYRLPDLVLPPGGYFLVWCDKDPDQGPHHAPFKLDKAGDALRLSTQTATHDGLSFGPQETDRSLARVPDGSGAWTPCASPSPGAANACPAILPSPTAPPEASPTAAAQPTATLRPTAVGEATGKVFLPALQR